MSGPLSSLPCARVWLPELSASFDNAVNQFFEVIVSLEALLWCGRKVRLVGWLVGWLVGFQGAFQGIIPLH